MDSYIISGYYKNKKFSWVVKLRVIKNGEKMEKKVRLLDDGIVWDIPGGIVDTVVSSLYYKLVTYFFLTYPLLKPD